MSIHLTEAPFFTAATEGNVVRIVALRIADNEWLLSVDNKWSLSGDKSSKPIKLATTRDPLVTRKFRTLDAAFALCRKYVPEEADICLDFRAA